MIEKFPRVDYFAYIGFLHVKIDKNWMCWDDAKKFETAGDYRHRLSGFYPISNNTVEGEFFCCGRDPGCH